MPAPRVGPMGEPARASPRACAGVLVVRADGYVMPRHPSHGAGASSSCAALPAPDAVVPRLEQERATPARRRLTSTRLRPSRRCGKNFETMAPRSIIHGGPAWRIFQVRIPC
jgi:hypothetical protein